MELSERVARLEALVARLQPCARDLEVIFLQLARAEGKLQRGCADVRSELRIVEQRLERAERRMLSSLQAATEPKGPAHDEELLPGHARAACARRGLRADL